MKSSVLPGKNSATRWLAATVATALAGVAALVPSYEAGKKTEPQEKGSRPSGAGDETTTLKDQTDLSVAVYNSNIALVRDVRQLQLPKKTTNTTFSNPTSC